MSAARLRWRKPSLLVVGLHLAAVHLHSLSMWSVHADHISGRTDHSSGSGQSAFGLCICMAGQPGLPPQCSTAARAAGQRRFAQGSLCAGCCCSAGTGGAGSCCKCVCSRPFAGGCSIAVPARAFYVSCVASTMCKPYCGGVGLVASQKRGSKGSTQAADGPAQQCKLGRAVGCGTGPAGLPVLRCVVPSWTGRPVSHPLFR